MGPEDRRVKAAVDWLSRRYNIDENQWQGKQRAYYYYFVTAKTLAAAKIDMLKADGKGVDWREELSAKLIFPTAGRWLVGERQWPLDGAGSGAGDELRCGGPEHAGARVGSR